MVKTGPAEPEAGFRVFDPVACRVESVLHCYLTNWTGLACFEALSLIGRHRICKFTFLEGGPRLWFY